MTNFTQKQLDKKFAIAIIVGVFFIALLSTLIFGDFVEYGLPISFPKIHFPKISFPDIIKPEPASEIKDIKKFASEEEFKDYLAKGAAESEYSGLTMDGGLKNAMPQVSLMEGIGGGGEAPERVSETTVQVPGIDEPDIVKTDGKEIYFSRSSFWRFWEGPIIQERSISPEPQVKTSIIKAFPPADLAIDADVDKSGDLLLSKNILVIFSNDKIYGYDVINPKSPEKKWEIKLENNNFIVAGRLYKEKIYLVTRQNINETRPCPIKPLTLGDTAIEIKCVDIYHPVTPLPVDVTFLALILDPNTGKIEKNISFVGSSNSSVVYMSENAVFITYSFNESIIKFYFNFLKEKAKDLVPSWLIEKMEKLETYDISQSAKMTEFQILWMKYLNSLDRDETLRIENELTNRMSDYYKSHKRELEKTGIVKIGLDGFEIKASGKVPGIPLNQFALDEYRNYLRIATTVGQRFGFFSGMGNGESSNDVYVLDNNLNVQGKVQDLGLTERIYSVRFIEDKGYLVTFRQVDPFYVLDLSNPEKPELKGELKIPGYSSYLHPIGKDKILGVGQENWQVKISLFDVSSAENPRESDKYILNEGWSDISNTHHAFLLDKKHEIFFLPAGQAGYVFSYKNDKLSLVRAVSDISARRAIYLDDYLYIIGDDKITVLNEINWEKVEELQF
jgi:uncharacterized secreted protein with C-terminal beta-propeller domain